MNSRFVLAGVLIVAAIAVLLFAFQSQLSGLAVLPSAQPEKLKVSSMTSSADSGLPIAVLKNTEILKENNSNAEFVSFSYGPPIVEAALAGKVDAVMLASGAYISLLSKSDDWVVVGRIAYLNLYLMVMQDSKISRLSDLKGKKIGLPYATGPFVSFSMIFESIGLMPGKDLEFVNIKPADLPLALETKQVEAVSWGEPIFTTLSKDNKARLLEKTSDIVLLVVSRKFIRENPQEVRNFLRAYKQAVFFTSKNRQKSTEWFAKEASFDFGLASSLDLPDPNFKAESIEQVNFSLSDKDLQEIQKKIDFEFKNGLISRQFQIKDFVDQSFQN